jgi:ABC-type sugar transport system ATPase subunit
MKKPAHRAGGNNGVQPATPGHTSPADGDGQMLLRLRGIGKDFGPVEALVGIDLDIPAGQVTALVGDNGAGKSTLIKAIAGIWAPSSGEIIWQGKPVHFRSPRDATDAGIATVYQDLALCDNLDIVANMQLGHEPRSHGLIDEVTMEQAAKRTLQGLQVTSVHNIRQPAGSLSGGQRQAIAVARSVYSDAKILLLDEPLAAMGVKEGAIILDLVNRLKKQGNVSIIIIAHNYGQVLEVCDRVNLLQGGRITLDKLSSQTSAQELTDMVVAEYRKALLERQRAEGELSA